MCARACWLAGVLLCAGAAKATHAIWLNVAFQMGSARISPAAFIHAQSASGMHVAHGGAARSAALAQTAARRRARSIAHWCAGARWPRAFARTDLRAARVSVGRLGAAQANFGQRTRGKQIRRKPALVYRHSGAFI